jgi:hypothetical protein
MVEGPGCKVKGEKIKGKLKGKIVKGVSGNAVDKVVNMLIFLTGNNKIK